MTAPNYAEIAKRVNARLAERFMSTDQKPGWRGRQRQTLSRPLPWWKRMTRWDWLFVALCLAGAAACVWEMR